MVGGVQIAPLDMVRNLGFLLDDELTMASHVMDSVQDGCLRLTLYPSVCPDVSI